ncbi:MAG: Glycosyltransferase [Phormidesmis priestleyi Ana]|uniref:Glycosyltransferase n=1 Tax=Phormidesmis priestleyi Ana TaxID=1666911 RepID=A0A0P8DKS7_9CYAN|nr:MAG: Glycosyltransferase [Phormidesmis priestleyi Ana]
MKKIAVVHEWLTSHAGSEKVVEQILKIYPNADLYSLVDFLPENLREFIQYKTVTTSFIQNLPFAKRHFRSYLPLMPLAIEQFVLSDYDLIISSHHAVAKGVLTRPDQLHISYVHTPLRYGWELQHQYLQQANLASGFKGGLTRAILHYMRLWDIASANRVDYYLANSRYVARRIEKTYRRTAKVIYPPVDTRRFESTSKQNMPDKSPGQSPCQSPCQSKDGFYLVVSRFVPYKRVDLAIAAFNQLGLPLVIIGDGASGKALRKLAAPNICFLGKQPDSVVEDYMQRCRGLIFPPEEDFGITPVEAQAAGVPVIAYAKGGQAETVLHEQTGLLFSEQTVESLVHSVKRLHSGVDQFDSDRLKANAERFSVARFKTQFKNFVDHAWMQSRESR